MAVLKNASTGAIVIPQLEIADGFWKRFAGLQFRKSLPENAGMLLTPCSSLHTCFMRFPIDVLMLDRDNRVLGVHRNVRPWRAVVCLRYTRTIVETNVDAVNIPIGTSLTWLP